MAKQKNIIEEQAPETGDETFHDNGVTAEAPEQKPKAEIPAQKIKEKPLETEADSFVLGILQSFPENESLYVDKYGGAFTADTPTIIRRESVLYKNPYYKSKKS